METINCLFDERSGCLSILTCMTLEEYKELAYYSFERSGNIEGQRDVIKKSSVASKIKKRMNDDFLSGAVFPPVVLGICLDEDVMEKAKTNFNANYINKEQLAIIDGIGDLRIF